MNKIILVISLLFLSVGCSHKASPSIFTVSKYNYNHSLRVGGSNLNVEIANTEVSMSQGLSDRPYMDSGEGMIFDFSKSPSSTQGVYPAFWMKGMNFNLDFIWIYKNKIVGITPDVPRPADQLTSRSANQLPSYFPPSPVTWVLEVNAGWAKKNNIGVGDVAELR